MVLGFTDPPAEATATQDVDGIIPRDLLASLQANEQWWTALKAANDELEAEGLYLTHLFDEEQIILRANWREQVVEVAGAGPRFLKLRRPATLDLILTNRVTVATRLGHVDVNGNLAQSTFDHKLLQKLRVLDERLPVRHEHRDQARLDRVPDNLDQFVLSSAAPVGIGHIPTRQLQTATRSLEFPIGVNLLLHLGQRRNRHLVGVFRQVAMRAAKRTVARARGEPTMRQMPTADLVRRP